MTDTSPAPTKVLKQHPPAAKRYRTKTMTTMDYIRNGVWADLQKNAKRRELRVLITLAFVWNLLVRQEFRCAVSGVLLIPPRSSRDYSATTSIDRIDSNLDYTEDNVQWIHKQVNIMKNDIPEPRFLELCGLISDHQRGMGVRQIIRDCDIQSV